MDGIAASSIRMKGGLRATLSCVCSTPEKSFEPFEPYLHSAMVQARLRLYCELEQQTEGLLGEIMGSGTR